MRTLIKLFFIAVAATMVSNVFSQEYGIWSAGPNPSYTYTDVKGSMVTLKWRILQPDNSNLFKWEELDKMLLANVKNKTILLIWVWGQGNGGFGFAPPDWTSVIDIYDCNTLTPSPINQAPDYTSVKFKSDFKNMIFNVRKRIDSVLNTPGINSNLKAAYQKIVAIQACFGSTGDYPTYKGYCDLNGNPLQNPPHSFFYEMSSYYDSVYLSSAIHVLHNPGNDNSEQLKWVLGTTTSNNNSYTVPTDPWLKMGDVGHAYQLNGEKNYFNTLNPALNIFQKLNGNYVRSRSELDTDVTLAGWWASSTADPGRRYRSMFTLLASALHFGLDISNQLPGSADSTGLADIGNKFAYDFYNRHAGQKDPLEAQYGFCLLRDALDASNTVRFSEDPTEFGPYGGRGTNKLKARFQKIVESFSDRGARLEDIERAIRGSQGNRSATGINDVGDSIIEGNYERYLTQIPVDVNDDGITDNLYETCDGHWTVVPSNDPLSPFGRYAKSISNIDKRNAMYFDIDDNFLSSLQLNDSIRIFITYYDSISNNGGADSILLQFRKGNKVGDRTNRIIRKENSKTWKTDSITIKRDWFVNFSELKGADFAIFASRGIGDISDQRDIIAFLEIKKIIHTEETLFSTDTLRMKKVMRLSVYPNPASHYFIVRTQNGSKLHSLNIFDKEGRLIFNKQCSSSTITISKNEMRFDMKPGIYYISGLDVDNEKHNGILKIE